jgi:threonine/homoserine/homoserine lactone efflux protein
MTLHGLLLFCLAYFLATASPGPGIAVIVARVLGRGTLRWLNRGTGTVMAGAAVAVATRAG